MKKVELHSQLRGNTDDIHSILKPPWPFLSYGEASKLDCTSGISSYAASTGSSRLNESECFQAITWLNKVNSPPYLPALHFVSLHLTPPPRTSDPLSCYQHLIGWVLFSSCFLSFPVCVFFFTWNFSGRYPQTCHRSVSFLFPVTVSSFPPCLLHFCLFSVANIGLHVCPSYSPSSFRKAHRWLAVNSINLGFHCWRYILFV